MRNIKLTIEYDGTDLQGWQIQNNVPRTVQGEIEKALLQIYGKKIRLIGSGRTDRGVHASGQVANFKVQSKMSCAEMLRALNGNLPDDITVVQVKSVPAKFHAQYSAKAKTYRYTVLNRPMRNSQNRKFSLFYPYPLNLAAIKKETRHLMGKHDFRSFMAADPKSKEQSTVRIIKKIKIQKNNDYIYIDITANGFLYKMVRNIVGTLLLVGSGKLAEGSIKKILAQKDRSFAGSTASPHGLNLLKVTY